MMTMMTMMPLVLGYARVENTLGHI